VSERAYTVREIDALRGAVERKWLFGTYRQSGSGGYASRVYSENDKTQCVEAILRTHMLAGHTAEDLYASEPDAAIGGAQVNKYEANMICHNQDEPRDRTEYVLYSDQLAAMADDKPLKMALELATHNRERAERAEAAVAQMREALDGVQRKLAEYLERLLQGRTLPNRWVGEVNDIVHAALAQCDEGI
jgi:hypothetical protein